MNKIGKVIIILMIVVIGLGCVGWLGLQIQPAPLPPAGVSPGVIETMPLPAGLPAPVERFYRQVYGENVPVIKSAVITGRATLRVNGLTMPGRFRFTHEAGRNYRHYIETTFYGLPFLTVNEHYLDGHSRLELPFGVVENEPKVDQAANLGLWAESIWFPAIFLTDPRVHWEAVDETTAILLVPFNEIEERFVVRFDSVTGRPQLFEIMRYKDAADTRKTLWINEARGWGTVNGQPMAVSGAVVWYDEGSAWAVFNVEETVFNAEVQEYVRAKGP